MEHNLFPRIMIFASLFSMYNLSSMDKSFESDSQDAIPVFSDEKSMTEFLESALYSCLLQNKPQEIALILQSGLNPNFRYDDIDSTPLISVITFRPPCDAELTNLLITNGAKVNFAAKSGLTPLMQAAYYRRKNIVEKLLAAGADKEAKDAKGKTAKDYADKGSEIFKLLE